jgi:hypothetical protein
LLIYETLGNTRCRPQLGESWLRCKWHQISRNRYAAYGNHYIRGCKQNCVRVEQQLTSSWACVSHGLHSATTTVRTAGTSWRSCEYRPSRC